MVNRRPITEEDKARGARLRRARLLRGLTLENVADEVLCSPSGLSMIESGRPVSRALIPHLERLYGHPLEWFEAIGPHDDACPHTDLVVVTLRTLSEQDRRTVAAFAVFLAEKAVP